MITSSTIRFSRRLLSLGSLAISSSFLLFQLPTCAQNITVDGTLGPAATLSGPNYDIQQNLGRTIGNNLFHSFGRFNLNAGEAARFQSGANIQNILARVTGGTSSTIDGLIFTQSANVNLFLINPSGIIFGPNASLDIGGGGRGSFIATTADALVWGNNPAQQFNARTPAGASSLLTLVGDPSGFLTSQTRPGPITVLGNGDIQSPGLSVFSNQRLLLLGGDVSLQGAVLKARGGRIEIGSVAGTGTVGLDLNTNGLSLQFPTDLARANISLNRSYVVTGSATTDSGDIAFQARNITLANQTQLQALTEGVGNAGDVLLTATESISVESGSTIFSTIEEGGSGEGGNILIRTPELTMSGGAQLQTLVRGNGSAGVVFVNTDGGSVSLSGPRTAMFSSILEGASNTITGNDFAGNVFDALLGRAGDDITGSVFISTGSLSLRDGAFLDSSTFGNSNAGAVIVLAQDTVSIGGGSFISSVVGDKANGNGGGIIISTGDLNINGVNTGLTTSTVGKGDAGLIFVLADGRIAIDGSGSGIVSKVEAGVNQAGGGVLLSSRSLQVRNGGEISVSNQGQGAAGEIVVFSRAVWLDQGSSISATTQSGNGGDITLKVAALIFTNGSNITTTAGTAQAGGNGGNILVNGNGFLFGGDRAFIVSAKPARDSNIVANAFNGTGGSIFVSAYKLQDIKQRPESIASNDIDASSRFGFQGSVTVSTLNIDPDRGTVALPVNLADASKLIAEGCDSRGKLALGRLVSTGRGGLPPSPTDNLEGEDTFATWVSSDRSVAQPPQPVTPSDIPPALPQPSADIVEAQGWIVDPDGSVTLVAQAPTAALQVPWLGPGGCRLQE